MKTLLVLIGLALILSGAGISAFAQQVTLKAGIIPIATSLPLFTAMDKGFFAEQGIKVETTVMAGGAVIIPALMGGSVELAHNAVPGTIIAKDKGFDIKIVANINSNATVPSPDPPGYKAPDAILVAKGSRFNTAKDLEGKRIAVNTLNNIVHLLVYEWMVKKGADPKNVHWVEMPFPNMGAALAAGSVDAVAHTEPFVTILLAQGQVRNLGWYWTEVRRDFVVSSYVATGPWLKKNPEVADRFFKAFAKGVDYINSRPDERGAILIKYIKMAPDLANRIVHYAYNPKQDVDSLQWWADLMLKHKLIAKRMDVNVLIHDTAR